jgi:non-specific serine/threonine protein kinase
MEGSVRTAVRAKALNAAGALTQNQGDYARAALRFEEALALLRDGGDQRLAASVLSNLGWVRQDQGAYEESAALYEESLALKRATGDERGAAMTLHNLVVLVSTCLADYERAARLGEENLRQFRALGDQRGIGYALANLAGIAKDQGDYARATALYEESLTIARSLEDRHGAANALGNLAHVAFAQGDLGRATAQYQECLVVFQDLGDQEAIVECLQALAGVAAAHAPAQAARLLGATEAIRDAIGAPVAPPARDDYDRLVASLRTRLGDGACRTAWTVGRSLLIEQAIAEALAVGPPPASTPNAPLTPREQQVARLIADGLTNRQIAAALGIAERTADTHVARLLAKLGVHTRTAAAAAIHTGLAPADTSARSTSPR